MLIALFRFFLSRAYSTIFSPSISLFPPSLSLSFSFRCFCQPAKEQSLFDCSLLFRRFLSIPLRGFCYSLIQRTAEPVQKEHNTEFLYEPGRRSVQRYGLCARRWKLNALHEVFLFLPASIRALHNLTGFSYESSSPCTIELILGVTNYVTSYQRRIISEEISFLAFNG